MKKHFLNLKHNISNKQIYKDNESYILAGKECFLTAKQLDSCKSTIRYYIKKNKKKKKKKFLSPWQFHIPITKKSKGSRMGSGKGNICRYICKMKMNGVLFVFRDVKQITVLKIYKHLKYKLPVNIYLKCRSRN